MKFILTDEQQKKHEEFKKFAQTIVKPYAYDNDKNEELPKQLITALDSQGYLGSFLPKEYNGLEMDMITHGLLNEEIGAVCSSTRSLITVHGMVEHALINWGTEEQKKQWLKDLAEGKKIGAFALTEPEIGSDANNIQVNAELKDETFVLNGTKRWISFGQIADLFILFARYNGRISAFIVPRDSPGLKILPIKGMLGLKATMGAQLELNNCTISINNLIGRRGTGLTQIALGALDYGRYSVAWGCVGIGQACMNESIKYALKREQFNTKINKHQLIQKMIAEMSTKITAARLLCMYAGYLKDEKNPNSINETCKAKYYTARAIQKIASDSVQIHAANGCSESYPVSRYFRDAKIMEIIEGTNQMHEIMISSNILRTRKGEENYN